MFPNQDQSQDGGSHGPVNHTGTLFWVPWNGLGRKASSPSTPCHGQRRLLRTRLLRAPSRKELFPPLLPLPSPCSPSPALGPSPRPSGPGRSWGRSRPWRLRRWLHFRPRPPLPAPLATAASPRHCGKWSPAPHGPLGHTNNN